MYEIKLSRVTKIEIKLMFYIYSENLKILIIY